MNRYILAFLLAPGQVEIYLFPHLWYKRKTDEKICFLFTAPELETKRSEPEARPHSTEEQEEDEEPAQESQPLLREVTIVTTTTTILPTEEEGESEEEKKDEEEDEQDEYADEQNEEVSGVTLHNRQKV